MTISSGTFDSGEIKCRRFIPIMWNLMEGQLNITSNSNLIIPDIVPLFLQQLRISSQSSLCRQHLTQHTRQHPMSRIGTRIAGSRYFRGRPWDLSEMWSPLEEPPVPCALLESRSTLTTRLHVGFRDKRGQKWGQEEGLKEMRLKWDSAG